jgi:hypothetical protein
MNITAQLNKFAYAAGECVTQIGHVTGAAS